MQHRNECQYAFSYRDADIIDQIGIREANRQCMQDVLLSLLQFANHDDIIEIYIDGCDNYAFDIGDFEYEFAQKLRTNRSNIYPSSQSENRCDLSEPKNPNGGSHKSPRTIQFVIHGDALVPVISAASIIAKVTRDHIMCDFHEDFPHYGFSSHKGYGTRKHQESLLYYGISPIHRKSYAPVKRLISPTSSL